MYPWLCQRNAPWKESGAQSARLRTIWLLLPSPERAHHSPVYTLCSATPNDLEFHKCGPAFAQAVPCTWKAYLASSPLCSADSLGLLRHRLTFSRKSCLSSSLHPLLQAPGFHGSLYRPEPRGLWHCVYSLSVDWSFSIGPSGSQTRLQKSRMSPPTGDLSNPRNEARECAFLLSLILRHSQFGELLPCLRISVSLHITRDLIGPQ